MENLKVVDVNIYNINEKGQEKIKQMFNKMDRECELHQLFDENGKRAPISLVAFVNPSFDDEEDSKVLEDRNAYIDICVGDDFLDNFEKIEDYMNKYLEINEYDKYLVEDKAKTDVVVYNCSDEEIEMIQDLLKELNKECIIHKMCSKNQKLNNRSAISFIRYNGKSEDMNVDEFYKISENANACICFTIDDDSIKEKLNNSKEAIKREFNIM